MKTLILVVILSAVACTEATEPTVSPPAPDSLPRPICVRRGDRLICPKLVLRGH